MSIKQSRKYCTVYGCLKTTEKNPDCSFFSLPTDPDRQNEWLKIIGRSDLISRANLKAKSHYVCSSHFDDHDLKHIHVLLPDAVPTRYLPEKSFIDSSQALQLANSSIDWDDIILNPPIIITLQPQENQLIAINNKSNEPATSDITPIAPELQDELTRNMRKLMQIQANMDRCSKDLRFYALNMYLMNPLAYRFIRGPLKLPSEKTLRRTNLKFSPKLDKRVVDLLSAKLKSFPEKAKYCTVCVEILYLKNNLFYDISNDELVGLQDIDGIKCEEVAGVVYVILLRSILVKWDQPVAYCFLSGVKNVALLESWIDGVIGTLFEIGFEVMALVTNQGNNFKKYAYEIKGIMPYEHYFRVNNKKIYYIFEVPQMLKCLRNNLGTKDTYFNGNRVSWQYIESLFLLESKKKNKLIPKITNGHILPNNFFKLSSVKYAAEIFSNTVSKAIHLYVDMKELPEEARETARFCVFMNNVFDILNSSTYKNYNIYKCALGSNNEAQLKVLQAALDVFGTIEWKKAEHGKGKTKQDRTPQSIASLPSFQVTINSILSISRDLDKLGYKRILTERLNLDPLENFADLVRRGASIKNEATKPTPVQFRRNFSKLFLKYILTKSPLSNRPDAFQKYFEDVTQLEANTMNPISSRSLVWLGGETDYRIELPDEHATIYVASYIFYKCLQAHRCHVLEKYAESLPDLAKTKVYDVYNRKAKFYGKLKLLHYPFIRYIEQLELVLVQNFKKGISSKLGSQLFSTLRDIPFEPPCVCFPKAYAIRLLVRLRIYFIIKAYNKQVKRRNISICEFLSEINKK